jgi:hypothetical protein
MAASISGLIFNNRSYAKSIALAMTPKLRGAGPLRHTLAQLAQLEVDFSNFSSSGLSRINGLDIARG